MTTGAMDQGREVSTRVLPRRAFLAAGLSALLAGGLVGLGALGALTEPKTESFQFSRGTTFATGEEVRLRGFLSEALQDDRFQVVIVGHTGDLGDAGANVALSEDRARSAAAVALALGIPNGQMSVAGVGGAAPLAKEADESDRAHQARLARVDVTLQRRR